MKAFRDSTGPAIARGLRHCLLVWLGAGCAAEPAAPPEPAGADTGSAISALGTRPADPATTAALLAKAKRLVRPGSVVQSEPRFGVPTFLWTSNKRVSTSRASWLAAGAAHPEAAAARAVLADYAPLYGLADTDVADASVVAVHDRGTGPVLVKLHAQLGGIEIFGEELSVVMTRKLESVAISGYLTSAATPPAHPGGLAFGLAAPAVAAAAVAHLANTAVDASLVVPAGSRDGYDYFALAAAAGVTLDEPLRVKRVYFHLPDGLEAAYYVEVMAHTGAAPIGTLSAGGSPLATVEAYAYVVSATTGQPLFRKNLTADAHPSAPREPNVFTPALGFTYRVWADPVTGIPLDTPAGNAPAPKVVAAPDGAQATFVPTTDITLSSFPFSHSDPWLAPGATETNGNNVDAFLDLFSPDGLGVAKPPADPPTGDFRAQITASGQFLHTHTPDGNGALAEGREGSIQQLFYDINFLHDWYYDSGFDEAAGNAQTSNYGRGGLQGDPINAEAQDFQGFSNANMTTGADGGRPRMRMYVFPSPANMIDVQLPAATVGKKRIGISMSGPQTFDVTADIVQATFASSGCTVTNAVALAGKLAMFDYDDPVCSFSTRILRLTTLGVPGIIMVFTSAPASAGSVANITNFVTSLTKPVVTISWNTGQLIKTQLASAAVTARLYRAADRDGALDNQIVAHEWFHYVSNRLIGNGTGISTNMSAGMGEGWSDFNSLMLTVRADDTLTPSNTSFNGAYAIATYATSGVPFDGSANQGYYFGIRRYPYSTDLAKNPLTFGHIANGVALPGGPPLAFGADGASNAEVHNTGEVWATMLWECYAALLRDTLGATPRLTFQQAQDRMKHYLIAALEVTPMAPTFTEARDALLAVTLASDPSDYVAFRLAFARRGAGPLAVSPARASATNAGVVEDFSTGPELVVDSATLDDSLGSCDSDGVLDHGEYGRLTVTLRNIGTADLPATTATITSSSDAWYPEGNTLAVPAIAAAATGTASLRVAYLGDLTGIRQLDFTVDCADAHLVAPLSAGFGFRTNTDETAAASATDTVEPLASAWTTGFDETFGNVAPWQRVAVSVLQHNWHVDDYKAGSDQYLISPVFIVGSTGAINLQFDHSWGFDFDVDANYDGGVVEMSVNGGAFSDIGAPAYTGTIVTYGGDVNPLQGRPGFVKDSPGTIHTSLDQSPGAGSLVQIRFRAASDSSFGAAGWTIDNIALLGVTNTPFATIVADDKACAIVPTSAELAIEVSDGVDTVTAGGSVTYTITATNHGDDDIIGVTVTDAFPSDLTCTWTCEGDKGGSCTASGIAGISERVTLPAGGSVTYLAACTLAISTVSLEISNTATVALPGPVIDPVTENDAATDTDTVVHAPALLFAGKTVTGSDGFLPDTTVTYTIELSNLGPGTQLDNPGDELIDVLPEGLTLVSASATSGIATPTVVDDTVKWNGALTSGASVTITIVATITADPGTTISNQASFHYDSDGNGTNDASGTTDAYTCAGDPPKLREGPGNLGPTRSRTR
jgi:uncharacterized repeat protein (TIGR01451 family)